MLSLGASLTVAALKLLNAAQTFTNVIANATTAARTWTFPDKDGTVAMISDITVDNLSDGVWSSWIPTWTGITIGNAIVDAKYKKIGKTVFARLDVTFGTTTTTTGGNQSFTLPVASVSRIAISQLGYGIGATASSFIIAATYKTTTDVYIVFPTTGASAGTGLSFLNSTLSWSSTNKLNMELMYEAA